MKKIVYILIALLVVIGIVWIIMTPGKASKYDQFAQCIRDTKTVTFWGAFWCPHCQAEKARFGKSAKYLPYTECSTPDGKGQLQVCIDAGITTYPTWDFATGTISSLGVVSTTTVRSVGEIELSELAERTGCALPK